MDRTIKIARVVGIWIFGLIACGCAGGVLGTAIKYGFETEEVPGIFAGMCAFACGRLWAVESRKGRT
jgi:hypothetical protein